MALAAALPSLTAREAVADTVYRVARAFDTEDAALFDSALTQDAILEIDGEILEGLDAIHTGCWDLISKLDTAHFISNIRVDVKDGASTASVTASVLAQHYLPGEGKKPGATNFTGGSLYSIDLVSNEKEGLWRATHWGVKIIWFEGDRGIVTGKRGDEASGDKE